MGAALAELAEQAANVDAQMTVNASIASGMDVPEGVRQKSTRKVWPKVRPGYAGCDLKLGDYVAWCKADDDLPEGAVGRIAAWKKDDRAVVKFPEDVVPKGKFSLRLVDLIWQDVAVDEEAAAAERLKAAKLAGDLFKETDVDGSGALDGQELQGLVRRLFEQLGEPLPDDVEELAAQAMVDHGDGSKGEISYVGWLTMLCNDPWYQMLPDGMGAALAELAEQADNTKVVAGTKISDTLVIELEQQLAAITAINEERMKEITELKASKAESEEKMRKMESMLLAMEARLNALEEK